MKHLQHFQKKNSESIGISLDAPGSEDKTCEVNALKSCKQTLADSEASSHNPNVADNIKNYCLYILMFLLTGYAVLGKFKNAYEKNVLVTNEGINILRVIFLAGRNIASGDLPERLLTQFKTISPDLYAQIDAVSVTSETVVSALWQYTFSLWLLQ